MDMDSPSERLLAAIPPRDRRRSCPRRPFESASGHYADCTVPGTPHLHRGLRRNESATLREYSLRDLEDGFQTTRFVRTPPIILEAIAGGGRRGHL